MSQTWFSRTRTSFPTEKVFYGSNLNSDGQDVDSWHHYHWMADRINPFIPGTARRIPGPVRHLKVTTVSKQSQTLLHWPGRSAYVSYYFIDAINSPLVGEMTPTGVSWHPSPGYSNAAGNFFDSQTYRNLCVEAFNKQITQVPSKISIVNSLIELKDFAPLFKGLAKVPKALRDPSGSSLRQLVSRPASNKRALPKRVAKSGVDTFLQWNFAWAPFISDLEALAGLVDRVTRRLNYLRQTKGKEVTVYFEKEDCYAHPQVGQVIFQGGDSRAYRNYTLRSYACTFHSTWTLKHNLQGLDDAWASLRATLADLGINNPLKIVWNAIPFSFMVDWVSSFSAWLNRSAIQPFTGQWDISRVTSSYKEAFTVDAELLLPDDGSVQLMRRVQVEHYNRLDGLPLTLGGFDFTQLTDTQQKLALSIPLARILK